jgi:hypothetical protein
LATANDGARARFLLAGRVRQDCLDIEAVASAHRLVGGSDLLDGNQLGVARIAIAHAGGVGFRRLTPTKGEGATLVRRPHAVIVTDDSLGFAVAKCV